MKLNGAENKKVLITEPELLHVTLAHRYYLSIAIDTECSARVVYTCL